MLGHLYVEAGGHELTLHTLHGTEYVEAGGQELTLHGTEYVEAGGHELTLHGTEYVEAGGHELTLHGTEKAYMCPSMFALFRVESVSHYVKKNTVSQKKKYKRTPLLKKNLAL